MEYMCTNAYEEPKNWDKWLECPNCGIKPKVNEYDNGRSTACGCGKDIYTNFSVHAESICSILERTGNWAEHNKNGTDDLRNNWNHWVKTGELLFDLDYKKDGRW